MEGALSGSGPPAPPADSSAPADGAGSNNSHVSNVESSAASDDAPAAASSPSLDPSSAGPHLPFYTPSMMLSTMNGTMSELGGSVSLQKKLPDGSFIAATPKDMSKSDLQAKLRQSAERVSHLPLPSRLAWCSERRLAGNALFAQSKYAEAMDAYTTCLVAMSPSTADAEERETSEREMQLPALLNLAACAINGGKLGQAIQFCDAALALPSGVGKRSYTAWRRRGTARLKRGEFEGAREDLREALAISQEGGAEYEAVQKELKKVAEKEKEGERNRLRAKKAMQLAFGADKSTVDGGDMAAIYDDVKPTHSNFKGIVKNAEEATEEAMTTAKSATEKKAGGGGGEVVGWGIGVIVQALMDCLRGKATRRGGGGESDDDNDEIKRRKKYT